MNFPALPRRLLLVLALASAALLRAADADEIAALRAADDERVASILAADAARLDAIFSDDLSYTHSNGKHDTKKSYTDAILTRHTVYHVYNYLERSFRLASPDIGLETGRVLITSATAPPR